MLRNSWERNFLLKSKLTNKKAESQQRKPFSSMSLSLVPKITQIYRMKPQPSKIKVITIIRPQKMIMITVLIKKMKQQPQIRVSC
jgi:hypothetical protein